jgi:hypothetical protein
METTLTIEVNKELSKTENLNTSIDWQELLERNKQRLMKLQRNLHNNN